jgi:uncharacterized damage-inducible protein DinB
MKLIDKPREGEYAPYAIRYIDLLPNDRQVLKHMQENFQAVRSLVLPLSEEKLLHRYAPGKWTIKETLVHIVDDERIFAYRALRFARNDATELPGFEQDDYTTNSFSNERGLASILDEYEAVRNSTIAMFDGLDDRALTRSGLANGHTMSVRAAAYHIAGHELHHLKILREKYL